MVDAVDDLTLSGNNEEGFSSLIATTVNPQGEGNSGNITINAPNVSILDGGQLFTGGFGSGNTGDLIIDAQSLTIDAGSISTFIAN
ncbi:hypothetical protein [Pleurocapsa sp. PCC 7319]|uniref:hypothetical protein n=1 Tax=Pleurocapsa sp. PCC 7319 TaxID=118161 RepID=UPI000349C298|nr:hypothetical protein [Pleurocapsa sp. PCC 7319]